ncbi:MAG: ATP-binding protein [Gemmatimonadaceae bacterium]|nr:ATP-binding protein [Gemmatimonadaceae bacterium]
MSSRPKAKPHFRVSPAVLGPLGIEQLQDPALAVLELIKNSWDADAKRVKIVVDQRKAPGKILVNDDGHGMALAEFKERWLVIGASYKRALEKSEGGRPLIGEKGLGRLASFALGNTITIQSARESGRSFLADVNWEELSSAASLEEYEVKIRRGAVTNGTRVEIHDLKGAWSSDHTEFLVAHAEFLASVPGERFHISFKVDGKAYRVKHALATINRLAEGSLEMRVAPDGTPTIRKCVINGADEKRIVFRDMKSDELDPTLAGTRLSLKFFRRDEAARRLSGVLQRNEVTEVLERYQGIRVFRDGINVPPYGLNRDDWAGLEQQRTSTGGPTLVPGNSQLVGELHVSKRAQPHLVITAGRSGFADQAAVNALAKYVRWTVRALGTARRAEHLGISEANVRVPARIDEGKDRPRTASPQTIRAALTAISRSEVVRANPALRKKLEDASQAITETLGQSEESLRLYAQLASTGIAATSFSHELRAEFDVVSEAIAEVAASSRKPDKELIDLLSTSWGRILAFAALFKVVPVKIRRHRKTMSVSELRSSAETILGLASPDKVTTELTIPAMRLSIVPAEVDSILLNLVSNSVKAVAESTNRESGRIRVRFEAHGNDLAIHVADNGCGISRSVAQIMFEPLEGKFAEGTGMGLPIVRYIAERYKGAAAIVRPPASGFATEFVVTLRNVVQ